MDCFHFCISGFVLTLSGWFAPPISPQVHRVRAAGPILFLVGAVSMAVSCVMCAYNQRKCCPCCYYIQNYTIQLKLNKKPNTAHNHDNYPYFYKNQSAEDNGDGEFVTTPLLGNDFSNVTVAGLDISDSSDDSSRAPTVIRCPPKIEEHLCHDCNVPGTQISSHTVKHDEKPTSGNTKTTCSIIRIHSTRGSYQFTDASMYPKDMNPTIAIPDIALGDIESFVLYRNCGCKKCVHFCNMQTAEDDRSEIWCPRKVQKRHLATTSHVKRSSVGNANIRTHRLLCRDNCYIDVENHARMDGCRDSMRGPEGEGVYQDGVYGDGVYRDRVYRDGVYREGDYEDGVDISDDSTDDSSILETIVKTTTL